MGVRRLLSRVAAGAPVPVFTVAAEGGRAPVRGLRLRPELELVDSPRAANVLLVAGRLPRALLGAVLALHDELSAPRLTVRWRPHGGERDELDEALPRTLAVGPGDDVVAAVTVAHRRLLGGAHPSEPHVLLDVERNRWRGVGPYGQGGKGMTGGTPYGRPLAGRAPDRDGLELDRLPLRVGPFFPPFPPGLALEVKLQGDVVQEARAAANPFDRWPGDPPLRAEGCFPRALTEPVRIAELELARARHHLAWLAEALRVQGLESLGLRALRLAEQVSPGSGRQVGRLRSWVRRSQVLRWSVTGAGPVPGEAVAGRGLGPVARASGLAEDDRLRDPAYRALGFEPVVHDRGDVRARWLQRLDEVAQSVELARLAGEARTSVTETVEGPRGTLSVDAPDPSGELLGLVGDALGGLEWGDAVATVVSLDLDLEEAAAVRHLVGAGE